MPELRTRSAGAKVTDKEYAEIEKLAEARGLNVGEWCREVILSAVSEAEADAPTVETLMAEIVGCILDARFVEPPIAEIIVTSDFFVLARVEGEVGANQFVGA